MYNRVILISSIVRVVIMFKVILDTHEEFEWIIISVGTAGDDDQQQCPNFARQLAKEHSVAVYNFDPAFEEDSGSIEHNVGVFRIKNGFPFNRNTASCKQLSEGFCAIVQGLLEVGHKVVLLSCATPIFPDAFFMAANQNLPAVNSLNLSLIGSYCKDMLSVIYSAPFLSRWYSNHLSSHAPLLRSMPEEHTQFWSRMKTTSDTYGALGETEAQRHEAFEVIKQQFCSMGRIEKTLGAIEASHLKPEVVAQVVTTPALSI